MISIIIPTLNRPDQMIRLIERLNDVVRNEEVIIVDDSKANQEEELSEVANFDLSYIHRGVKLGVSSARNVGSESAKGHYLLFFDDDDDFTADWLTDFRDQLISSPDLIFCDMKRTDLNQRLSIVRCSDSGNGGKGNGIVIPGAWVVKKKLFLKEGGYDERLLYAENTEFFIRLEKQHLLRLFVPKANFLYYPSPTGGSKNLQNMIDSLLIILDKHQNTLSNHVKYLYHQIIGVNYMRFQNFPSARKHLLKAISYKPYKTGTIARLGISLFPPLARKLYPKELKL